MVHLMMTISDPALETIYMKHILLNWTNMVYSSWAETEYSYLEVEYLRLHCWWLLVWPDCHSHSQVQCLPMRQDSAMQQQQHTSSCSLVFKVSRLLSCRPLILASTLYILDPRHCRFPHMHLSSEIFTFLWADVTKVNSSEGVGGDFDLSEEFWSNQIQHGALQRLNMLCMLLYFVNLWLTSLIWHKLT